MASEGLCLTIFFLHGSGIYLAALGTLMWQDHVLHLYRRATTSLALVCAGVCLSALAVEQSRPLWRLSWGMFPFVVLATEVRAQADEIPLASRPVRLREHRKSRCKTLRRRETHSMPTTSTQQD
eukprot:5560623-Amphidinium_carterae.1